MPKKRSHLNIFMGTAFRHVFLFSVMLASCRDPNGHNDFPAVSSGQNKCLNLTDVRYVDPPIYDKKSSNGVEVAVDTWTGKLQLWQHDRYYESENFGESWKSSNFPTFVMNEDLEDLPIPAANSQFRYRIVRKFTKRYYDYYGMPRTKRQFIERSEDAGKTWKRAKGVIANSREVIDSFTLLAYHPNDPKIFYVSAGVIGNAALAGLYASKDGGDSFELKLVGRGLFSFAVSRSNPSIMYAQNEFGHIVRSENGGEWWKILPQSQEIQELVVKKRKHKGTEEVRYANGNDIYQIQIDPINTETVYILSKKGLIRTNDSGKRWCVVDLGSTITTSVNSMVISQTNPATIILGTWAGLFRSRDGGKTWDEVHFAAQYPGAKQKLPSGAFIK